MGGEVEGVVEVGVGCSGRLVRARVAVLPQHLKRVLEVVACREGVGRE